MSKRDEIIGLRIRSYRIGTGFTQAQLSTRTRCTEQRIAEIESGQPGTFTEVNDIADVLGVPLHLIDCRPYELDPQARCHDSFNRLRHLQKECRPLLRKAKAELQELERIDGTEEMHAKWSQAILGLEIVVERTG